MDNEILKWWCSLSDKQRFRIIEDSYDAARGTKKKKKIKPK